MVCLATLDTLHAASQTPLRHEYPYAYRSAAFLGRGDAGLAIADDEDAIFYNPAGVARGKGIFKRAVFLSPMIEMSQSARDLANRIGVQGSDPTDTLREQVGKPQHLGMNAFSGLVMRRAALGLYVHGRNTGYVFKDPDAGALETVYAHGVNDAGLAFAVAEDFGKRFRAGFTLRHMQRLEYFVNANVAEAQDAFTDTDSDQLAMQGTGTALDVGVQFSFGRKRFASAYGLTIQDVGNTQFAPAKSTTLAPAERPLQPTPQTVNLGAAWMVKSHVSEMKFLVDLRDVAGNTGLDHGKKLHLGTELNIAGLVGMVAGVNQGYPTAGFFLDLHVFRLDLGSYTEEVDSVAGQRGDVRYYGRIFVGL